MAQLQERVRKLTTQWAERRMARALLRLAAQAGRDGARGTMIGIRSRRKDFVEFAETTLHTASWMLAASERAGWLAGCGKRLTIRNHARHSSPRRRRWMRLISPP